MNDVMTWRHCGTCKKSIGLNTKHFVCTISGCAKSVYCSMGCFDAHVPIFRHKDPWAEERLSPKVMPTNDVAPQRIDSARLVGGTPKTDTNTPKDVLVVASKLKDYIDAKSGMNTSGTVLPRLSDIIRIECDKAIERARNDGRKTVMDRDFVR